MKTKTELEAELASIQEKMKELRNELNTLENESCKLIREINNAQIDESTQELLKSVFSVNADNSIRVELRSDTKTTPIMDEFFYSDKTFLIFENIFRMQHRVKGVGYIYTYFSLIVTGNRDNVNYDYNGLTMTDLKKLYGLYIDGNSAKGRDKRSREYPLRRELSSVCKKIKNGDNSNIIPFDKPCLIGGQTYRNQSGFGSEYCGDELVYQGTLYGETSKFMIIGVLVEKYSW